MLGSSFSWLKILCVTTTSILSRQCQQLVAYHRLPLQGGTPRLPCKGRCHGESRDGGVLASPVRARVSGGHLCRQAEAPTEPEGETVAEQSEAGGVKAPPSVF